MTRKEPTRSKTTLTVWLYDSAMGAAAGEVRLKDMQQQAAVTVVDAVTVTWVPGAHQPRIGRLRPSSTGMASRGSVLGALVGTLFLAPLVGAAAGAGVGAIAAKIRGSGIDDRFLDDLKENLTPGTSALLVLSSDVDLDIVRPFVERGLARGDVRLMHAWLPDDAPEALRALVDESTEDGPPDGPGFARSG